jgi:hypothetical protein
VLVFFTGLLMWWNRVLRPLVGRRHAVPRQAESLPHPVDIQ